MSYRAIYSKALYARDEAVPKVSNKRLLRRQSSSSFVAISHDFVRQVEEMEQCVLVPTKLMDIECKDDPDVPMLILLNGSGGNNLYNVYSLIRSFKEKLAAMDLDDEQLSCASPRDIDESITQLTSAQLSHLDSGNWSSGSTGNLTTNLNNTDTQVKYRSLSKKLALHFTCLTTSRLLCCCCPWFLRVVSLGRRVKPKLGHGNGVGSVVSRKAHAQLGQRSVRFSHRAARCDRVRSRTLLSGIPMRVTAIKHTNKIHYTTRTKQRPTQSTHTSKTFSK